ncbi:MAG: DsrE family protein [Psychroflexus sp.]|nr:DsrE family protein [Psychroflexus sp.]MDN6310069.1 DsrE family protein [Psychroflexus sp.]
MKNLRRFVTVLFAVFVMPMTMLAQEQAPKIAKSSVEIINKSTNFAMGVTGERQLRDAFEMYEKFKNSGVEFDNFEIVIWSGVVKDLKKGSELAQFIETQMEEGLKVSVCQIALDYFEMSAQDIPQKMQVVPDAYVRLFELQALGYNLIVI